MGATIWKMGDFTAGEVVMTVGTGWRKRVYKLGSMEAGLGGGDSVVFTAGGWGVVFTRMAGMVVFFFSVVVAKVSHFY